jgi:ATP-dependent RNA circularization protein (DNA/RNA ligase family)
MIEYHKIEPPFIREDGTKKLIEGKFKNETLEFLKDLKWQFTEKIDGTNISIVWDGHKVEFHGRTERAQIPAHLVNKLNDLFGGQINEEMFEQIFGDTSMILYGEGYGYKIQNGGAYRDDVSFILFDVYQPTTDIWLKREAVESIANQLGIEVVPIILEGTINDAVEFVKTEPLSTIGKAKMEGVVGRPCIELKDRMGKRVITKIKVFDFVR